MSTSTKNYADALNGVRTPEQIADEALDAYAENLYPEEAREYRRNIDAGNWRSLIIDAINTDRAQREAQAEAAVGMDARFWIDDSLDSTDAQPYGDATVGIVDESAGGVIAYVHEGNAQRIIRALAASLPEEVGTV